MKKILSILFVALLLLGCTSSPRKQDQEFLLKGVIKDSTLQATMVRLYPTDDVDKQQALAEARVEDHQFAIIGSTQNGPYSALIVLSNQADSVIYSTRLIIEQGHIKVMFLDHGITRVSGTPINEKVQAIDDLVTQYNEQVHQIYRSDRSKCDKKKAFVQAQHHRDSLFVPILVQNINQAPFCRIFNEYKYWFNIDDFNLIEDKMNEETRGLHPFRVLTQTKNTAVGNTYIDIRGITPKGDSTSVSNYFENNDYVLCNFWASWCYPCIREMKELKEIYPHLHEEGLEIVSHSIDDKAENWLGALKKQQFPWPQIACYDSWSCDATINYGITYLPSMVLIDTHTKEIVARNPSLEELELSILK